MNQLKALKNAKAKGKLAHAYLLSGNDEPGKERVIEEFVEFLSGSLQGKVRADVVFVSPQKDEITIGQIRKLKEKLSQSAWDSCYKIGVVWHAEKMNLQAQSAFLKLLEEPKGDTLFLLEVSHSSLLLDTIRSRAQELKMYAFPQKPPARQGLLAKLQQASIYDRFEFAKKAAEDQKTLHETLVSLQQEARARLFEDLQEQKTVSVTFLRTLHDTLRSLRTARVSARLAAERIFLEL
jgi:DNA polymerase III delta prime subunit